MSGNGEDTRAKIDTEPLVARLADHSTGRIELTPAQVRSIEILLRKSMPDLLPLKIGEETKRQEDALAEFE